MTDTIMTDVTTDVTTDAIMQDVMLKVGCCYDGKTFNGLVKHTLYRVTNEEENHNDFQYNTGLNVDILKFQPSGECKAGGLYFFDRSQVTKYLDYVDCGYWVRKVEIPDDALVYVENNKYKADKFVLHDKIIIGNVDPGNLCEMYDTVSEFLKTTMHRTFHIDCMKVLEKNGLILQYMNKQTEAMCLEAVKQNYDAFKYVKEQTEAICLEAVKQDAQLFRSVKAQIQTDAICLIAVEQFGSMLKHVKTQNEEICLTAVRQNGLALEFVQKQTEEICFEAVKNNGYAIEFVDKSMFPTQFYGLCLEAVRHNGSSLRLIRKIIKKL